MANWRRMYRESDFFPRVVLSLNDQRGYDDGKEEAEIGETIPDPNPLGQDEFIKRDFIGKAISAVKETLDEREREILRLRFEEDWTLEEIGIKLDLSRERVRQIQWAVLTKSHKALKEFFPNSPAKFTRDFVAFRGRDLWDTRRSRRRRAEDAARVDLDAAASARDPGADLSDSGFDRVLFGRGLNTRAGEEGD